MALTEAKEFHTEKGHTYEASLFKKKLKEMTSLFEIIN